MISELFNNLNGIPQWAYGLGWGIVLTVIIFLRWFWKTYGNKVFAQWAKKVKEKDEENERLLFHLKDNEIDQDHYAMLRILDKCADKGYCNSQDIEAISRIYHHYTKIGGNTDGERIMAKFDLLPYRTELKVPRQNGTNNPSEEAMKYIIEFYNLLKTGVIPEDEIKKIRKEFSKKK